MLLTVRVEVVPRAKVVGWSSWAKSLNVRVPEAELVESKVTLPPTTTLL